MPCPACGESVRPGDAECPRCGVVLAKWHGRERPRPERTQPGLAPKATRRSVPLIRPLLIAAVIAGAGIGAWWWTDIRPRMKRMEDPTWGSGTSRAGMLRSARAASPLDRSFVLPGSPIGIAMNGKEFVVANRTDPWGFLRLSRRGDELAAEQVTVVDETYGQKLGFSGVTWNGREYVAIASGSAVGSRMTTVFTRHDARTLHILGASPAPAGAGCIAWSGDGYWAASRKNTADADEPQHLYRFDREFRETARFPSPAEGCQGLAWDGEYLWMADVFGDEVFVLDPSPGEPELVERRALPLDYLSGIAVAGDEVWLAEYGENRLVRVAPPLVAEWRGKRRGSDAALFAAAAAGASFGSHTGGEQSVAEHEEQLRSEDWADRMRAADRLRQMGAPVRIDREHYSSVDTGPEDADLIDWEAEIRGDALYASWAIHFGEALFSTESRAGEGVASLPLFARYEVSVEGGTLAEEITREFDAQPGENAKEDVLLARDLGPGEYEVSLFIHVQYYRPDGGAQILNRSFPSLTVQR